MTSPAEELRTIKRLWAGNRCKTIELAADSSIRVYCDKVGGNCDRWVFIMEEGNEDVVAIASLTHWEDFENLPCLHLGYAVVPDSQGKGYGEKMARLAISSIETFLNNKGITNWYVSALVGVENIKSHVIARKVFGEHINRSVDPVTKIENLVFRQEYKSPT